ncbi:hypothetical protein QNH46_09105 [Paenibacillus woosongensis]|uniref:Phenylacetate--CoA ligase family protein n=1 Tax=Paenibacillus woosongensis TaxID=307580 RepID=A0AA95L228_9BACL|nr:hypothetical protein [Paenibacillus woosongensis]WHX50784.1 hypothetical protein QNH46_09105 [Paenibacillus woosongensis]
MHMVEHIKPFQLEKISNLLTELYRTNSYYKEIFHLHDVNVGKFLLKEFKKLPYLTKEDIRHNYEQYLSSTSEEIFLEMTTGTTGRPMKCPKTKTERLISTLAIWDERKKWDPDVNINNFVSLYGSRFGDAFNFDVANMRKIFDSILQTNPRWLSAPITAIKKYAKLAEQHYANKFQIKFIELVGEYADRSERQYIEQVFGCKTIVHYGLRETWGIAYECPEGNLHVRDDIFFIEEAAANDNMNELIVTSFYNKLMPIIRYRTGDIGRCKLIKCNCGQEGQVIELMGGRVAGVIKGPNEYLGDIFFKRVMSNMHELGFDCIDSFVVVQSSIDQFDIQLVKKNNFTDESARVFHQLINNRLGREMKVNLIFMKEIPVSPSGKSQIFKCVC